MATAGLLDYLIILCVAVWETPILLTIQKGYSFGKLYKRVHPCPRFFVLSNYFLSMKWYLTWFCLALLNDQWGWVSFHVCWPFAHLSRRNQFESFDRFLTGTHLLLLSWGSSWRVPDINPLVDTHFANLLLICLLAVLKASFDAQKLLIPMKQYPFLILLPVPYYKVLLDIWQCSV